ncbi:MAG: hypothetical protein IJ894_04055, partial [Bacteroidales bacterium]|nr:hypothetical protein [Bacteroidales bacterium]
EVATVPSPFIDTKERTLVIYTPAVPVTNKIFTFFKTNGYNMHKRAEVLGMIANNYTTIAVSGTHGKTTNSCVLANIVKCAGKDGFAFLGASRAISTATSYCRLSRHSTTIPTLCLWRRLTNLTVRFSGLSPR